MELAKWTGPRGGRALLGPVALWAALAAGARGELIMTEVMYDPASTSDGSWEYIEVLNAGGAAVDLSAFVLDDESGNALTAANVGAGVLQPGGVAVLYNGATAAADLDAAWLAAGAPAGHSISWIPVSPWPGLTNSGEHLGLWSDLASYGARDFTTADDELTFTATAPWPEPDGAASMYWTDPLLDHGLGTSWALSQPGVDEAWSSNPAGLNAGINVGSPGVAAAVAVPEPSGLVLAVLAMLGGWGACLRRRRGPALGN